MKNISIKYIIYAIIGIVAAVAIANRLGLFDKSEGSTETAAKSNAAGGEKKPDQPIKAYIVKKETLEDVISAVGNILPNEEVALTCETSGKITKIYFEEGAKVSKGQLLLQLNDAELQAQLKKALINKEFLEKKKSRDEQLHARKGISDEAMESLNTQLSSQIADIDVIKSRIEQTKLFSPFVGQIGLRYVSEGAYVNPNVKIAQIIDINSVKIDFSIPEKYSGIVKKGTRIYFKVSGKDKKFEALVYASEPKIDPTTRTLQVRAVAGNANNELLPGGFAYVRIVLEKIENAVLIPTQALIPELNLKKVFVLKGGQAVSVAVEIGIRTEDKIQIIDGLKVGDTIITSGIMQLKNGANVKITAIE